jgi:sugar O-acyltransferase (sialic acid O-acetyltransferase NeuD family)
MKNTMQTKRLFIIGASSLGREIESWLELVPIQERDWEIIGYLDTDQNSFSKYPSDYPLLGNENDYVFGENDYCIIAIATPSIREKVYNNIKDRVKLYTFIANNVITGKFSTIGEGCIICPNCIVSTNVKIGAGSFLNGGTQIGHDVVIGDFTAIMANVDIAGCCTIGKRTFIGSKVVVIPSTKIGDDCKIGAGSVVIRTVKDGYSVFGCPAKRIN